MMLLSFIVFFKSNAETTFITIATGGVTGVYYPAGGAVCRLVNSNKTNNIRCSVESTAGSIHNIKTVRRGVADIGIVQSDWEYNAYNGYSIFKNSGPDKKMRSLFSLHSEFFTVIVRKDSDIHNFSDIVGHRVNIGRNGSGTRATMEEIMKVKKWTKKSFLSAVELKSSEQASALCDDKIDVMIFISGHPNGATNEALRSCDTRIIPVDDPDINQLVESRPYYAKASISSDFYDSVNKDIPTFAMKSTFITSADVDDLIIYNIVKSIFDNFEEFQSLHPVFKTVTRESAFKDATISPLHNGARRYYLTEVAKE